MISEPIKDAILDSLKSPMLFCDLGHIIQYMNKSAATHYNQGCSLIGQSMLDCCNEESQQQMVDIVSEMKKGLEERLITDNEKYRIYMRAVRDAQGRLPGYYERYEPPLGS